jgi:GNAT superfamily N-acetyltransferase
MTGADPNVRQESKTAMALAIERLTGSPADRVAELVAESERHGLRFIRRLTEDWTSGVNRFDRPGEALFVARLDERIVGVCGLNVDPYAAEPRVGRVRHLYVLSGHRRLGVGRRLVSEVIETARGRFDRLRLRTENPGAAQFYEAIGFRSSGATDNSTHVMVLGG